MTFPEPPPLAAPTTCFFHADRQTGRRCTRCGRYACPECLHQAAVGSHCWECVKAAQPPMTQQVKAKLAQPMLVTKIIIAANALAYLAKIASVGGTDLFSSSGTVTAFDLKWGLSDLGLASGHWWQPVTSGFLHFGLMHIGFNMLILWRLGEQLEDGIGRLRFTTLYFACLLAGSFGSIVIDKGVAGGASGAVFGLAGAATVALWQRGVRFWQTGWGPLLAFNLVFTFIGPNISVGGHIGGLTAGLVLGVVMLDPRYHLRSRAAGYAVAVLIMVASVAGSFAVAKARNGTCVELPRGQFECSK